MQLEGKNATTHLHFVQHSEAMYKENVFYKQDLHKKTKYLKRFFPFILDSYFFFVCVRRTECFISVSMEACVRLSNRNAERKRREITYYGILYMT